MKIKMLLKNRLKNHSNTNKIIKKLHKLQIERLIRAIQEIRVYLRKIKVGITKTSLVN